MRPASTLVKAPVASSVRVRTASRIDGGADLTELAGPVRLGARLLEGDREVSVESFGSLE
jgi:hypothetical protein